jgi:PAS domain S-box-containing protein
VLEQRDLEELFQRMREGFALHELLRDAKGTPVDYRFLAVNPAFEELTGLRAAEVVGRTVREVFPGHEPALLESYGRLALGGEPAEFELKVPMMGRSYAVRVYRSSPTSFACIFSDVTRRLHAEQELASAVAEVERREEERRALHAILLEAHTMETIGSLAAGIAHDFNNLLGAILGGLSLLELEHGERLGIREDLDELKAHVERGSSLVRQLLGYARRGKYNPRPVALDAILPGLLSTLRRSHAELAIVVDANAEGLTVLADRTQLELAVMNLLLNGAEATPARAVLRVRTEAVTLGRAEASPRGVPPGRYVKLAVSDSGPGLDAAARARAFEPIFDSTAATSGLRLASVQGILRNHGGFATVESEPGQGATFSVYWPVQKTFDHPAA